MAVDEGRGGALAGRRPDVDKDARRAAREPHDLGRAVGERAPGRPGAQELGRLVDPPVDRPVPVEFGREAGDGDVLGQRR